MSRSVVLASLLLAAAPLSAQEISPFVQSGERAQAMVFLAKMDGEQFAGAAGAMFLTYGQPDWKKELGAQADQMKGKIIRLGKDNWATLDNTPGVALGGVSVPAGVWYLGLACDQAGKWSLVCIDPVKAKAAGAWPYAPELAPRTHSVPLTHDVLKTEEFAKLTVSLEADAKDPMQGTLVIGWGNHKLSTNYAFKAEKAVKNASADKDGK